MGVDGGGQKITSDWHYSDFPIFIFSLPYDALPDTRKRNVDKNCCLHGHIWFPRLLGTVQNLFGDRAGFWGFLTLKKTPCPPFSDLKKLPAPLFFLQKKSLPPFSTAKKSSSPPCFFKEKSKKKQKRAKKSTCPPFFKMKKRPAPLFFSEKKFLPPFFYLKKSVCPPVDKPGPVPN